MTSSVFTEPSPQYRTATGEVCAGGSLKFFASQTTNPQDVYSDSALTTNIGATVTLGSDGRATGVSGTITVYLDDSKTYRAQLFDANGAKQWDVDPVNPSSASGSTIPAQVAGDFLSTDGSQLLWDEIRQLPDPTGQANKILSTDGTNFNWVAKPADGAAGSDGTNAAISATDAKTTIGDGTAGHDLLMIQRGSGTAPATGQHNTSASITFPTPYKSAPWVQAVGRSLVSGTIGVFATPTVISTTGASFTFSTNDDNDAAAVVSSMPFDWIAIGTLAG
jgi:hypothetical protein